MPDALTTLVRRIVAWARKHPVLAAICVLFFAIWGAGIGGGDSASEQSRRSDGASGTTRPAPTKATGPLLDANTVHSAIATEFLRRHRRAVDKSSKLADGGVQSCDGESQHFDCGVRLDVFGPDETWNYKVVADTATGCLTGKLTPQYGAYQDNIDGYRDRETFSLPAADIKREVRVARKLRVLKTCVASDSAEFAGSDDPAKFIEGMATQDTQRKFGRALRPTCRSTGKETAGPDSYTFACSVVVNGKRYVDSIDCFDDPPYTNYDSCIENDGYPKLAPRALP